MVYTQPQVSANRQSSDIGGSATPSFTQYPIITTGEACAQSQTNNFCFNSDA